MRSCAGNFLFWSVGKRVETKDYISVLNPKQLKAAELLADPDFKGTITDLCAEIGVARSTYYKWLDNEEFRHYTGSLIDKYAESDYSRAWKSLMRRVDAGDISALRLYFELQNKVKAAGSVSINFIEDIGS